MYVNHFSVGEEVMFEGERFVIADISDSEPIRYRLLATHVKGTQIEWASKKQVKKIVSYTKTYDDTALY